MSNIENHASPTAEQESPPAQPGRSILIDSPLINEDQAEYNSLLASLQEEFLPETSFQHYLVRKIANNIWRSLRLNQSEVCHIHYRLDNYQSELDDPIDARIREIAVAAGIRSLPYSSTSDFLLRDEMRLDRQLSRTIRLLLQTKLLRAKLSRKSRPAKKMPKKHQKMGPPFVSESEPTTEIAQPNAG